MTYPSPPSDPLWQPSPPPPDPVLQPPAPMPWDQPWQPPTSPAPASAPPPPSRPAEPIAPFEVAPPPSIPSGVVPTVIRPPQQRPTPKNRLALWLIPAVLLAICCGVVMAGLERAATFTTEGQGGQAVNTEAPATLDPPTPQPTPSLSVPVTVVSGGPATSFDLPVGTGVRFTDQDGTWIVALLGIEWVDECEGFLGAAPALVVDIQYEVIDGAVSVIPMNDFGFALADGTTAPAGLLTTCAEPPLDITIVSAGEVHRGRFAFQLPAEAESVSGTVTYAQLLTPTASWTIPER